MVGKRMLAGWVVSAAVHHRDRTAPAASMAPAANPVPHHFQRTCRTMAVSPFSATILGEPRSRGNVVGTTCVHGRCVWSLAKEAPRVPASADQSSDRTAVGACRASDTRSAAWVRLGGPWLWADAGPTPGAGLGQARAGPRTAPRCWVGGGTADLLARRAGSRCRSRLWLSQPCRRGLMRADCACRQTETWPPQAPRRKWVGRHCPPALTWARPSAQR
jgi:hypothetical protein